MPTQTKLKFFLTGIMLASLVGCNEKASHSPPDQAQFESGALKAASVIASADQNTREAVAAGDKAKQQIDAYKGMAVQNWVCVTKGISCLSGDTDKVDYEFQLPGDSTEEIHYSHYEGDETKFSGKINEVRTTFNTITVFITVNSQNDVVYKK